MKNSATRLIQKTTRDIHGKEFLKPKTRNNNTTLKLNNRNAKINTDKAEFFADSFERHFRIKCNNFDDKSYGNQYILSPLESVYYGIHDKDSKHALQADVDS